MLIADYHHKDDHMSDLSEMIYDLCANRDLYHIRSLLKNIH